MNKTEYMVYWTNSDGVWSEHFWGQGRPPALSAMNRALAKCEELRKDPANKFITMASESDENIGKAGVTSIEDGKTPDGEDYTWSKQHRAGGTRGQYHSIIDNKSNE